MFKDLNTILIILTAIGLAFLLALWISLVIWTVRDIRTRTKDRLLRFLTTFSVIVFSFPGFLIYLILRPRHTFSELFQTALEEEALLQSIEGFDTCPNCGHDTKEKWNFCPYCENQLAITCSECGESLRLDWVACPACGTSTQANPESSAKVESVEGTDLNLTDHPAENGNYATINYDDNSLEEEDFDSFQEN